MIERVEQIVCQDLMGAKVIGLVEYAVEERTKNDGYLYKEWIYVVAWQNKNECGTHRVCVNNNDEQMCISGVYRLTREQALADLVLRAGLLKEEDGAETI